MGWIWMYKYKEFSDMAELTDFLNDKDISNGDIVSIMAIDSKINLLYMEPDVIDTEEDND